MTKVAIRTLDSVTNNDTTATQLINENFTALQTAIENTLSRDGTTPNFMDANLDLNSYKIINAGTPTDNTDVITKEYFDQNVGDAAGYAAAAASSAQQASTFAGSANNYATAAAGAADVAQAARDYIESDPGFVAVSTDLLLGEDSSIKKTSDDLTNIDTVAGSIANVNAVGTDIAKVTAVADDLTNIDAVVDNETNINAVADDLTNINTVAGSISNVNSVGSNIAKVTAVADDLTNIDAVNANKTNIDAVAGNSSNINAVADDLTNINAVAADLTNIDNASSYAAEAKQWAIGDPSEPTGNSAKWWAEHSGIPSQTGQSGKFLTTDGTDASWADVDALPSQTGQSGKYLTTDGSSASWATLNVNPDNKSITTNSSDELQTVGVINSRDSSTAVKTWTGTKAQYDAIQSKDANTLYNITDDTDVSLTILEALYPVGSVYITTANTCPLSTLISGSTWELVSSGRVLQGSSNSHTAGTTIEAGLPNIEGHLNILGLDSGYTATGAFSSTTTTSNSYAGHNSKTTQIPDIRFNASNSNSIYGNSSTVQPPAYIVNIYRRTA